MIHADLREKLRDKKIGILGEGYIGGHLFKLFDAEKEALNVTIHPFNRKNLLQVHNHRYDYFFDCADSTGDHRIKILRTVEANTSVPMFLLRNLKVNHSLTVLSSSRIYGFHTDRNLVIDEDYQNVTPHLSIDFIHDGSKQLMESIFYNYSSQVPYKIQLVRLSHVYGRFGTAQLNDGSFLKVMAKHHRDKTPIDIIPNPESSRDYVFIDDALDGILRAAILSEKTDYFNIASGKSYTIKDWIKFLGLNPVYKEQYPSAMHCTISIEKARKLLSYSPASQLRELQSMIQAD